MNCPECGNKTRAISTEITCIACGLVIEDAPVQHDALNPAAPATPELARAGTFQYQGKVISAGWLFTTKEKNIQAAQRQIGVIASKIRLPTGATVEANRIFKRASERNLTRGRDNQSFIYASIYAACIMQAMPKTPLEITAYSSVSKKRMLRAYRQLNRTLGLHHTPIQAIDLLQRFGSRLELPQMTITHAATLVQRVTLQGRHPETVAAAALYTATKRTGERRTQRDIANTTGVIEVTIRKFAKTFRTEETP